ncbi:MAG: nucleotidyltransferase domain-containing protein [Nanoarchaeota archaeon]|nr:nucleotidyltransferase domain-containing protein [Nanoarchaeota archaeon]
MKQREIMAYTYDFVSLLLEKKEVQENLKKIVLFGSVARGNFDEESDIDLFIEVKESADNKKIEDLVHKTVNIFEVFAEKTWNLRGINLPIKFIVARENDPDWIELKEEIQHYGILMYGEYKEHKDNYALISYSLNKLKQNDKMNFLRKLYGYAVKKKKKIYSKSGLISAIGAVKTATNQILVRIEKIKDALDLLKEFEVPYTVRKISA